MLALGRLDKRDRAVLVTRIAAKILPAAIIDQIADRTDGVPLFVEELTKSVLESGLLHERADRYVLEGALPPLAIPTSLQDSLMARLDRLSSVRRVAQIGAAIGREFSYELLRAVSSRPEDELRAALAGLVASGLAFRRGAPPDEIYSFKHTLVQDAAHESLLRSSRQQLHAQIAEALEARSPELMDTQPELLARHYAEAGLVEKSVLCWAKAGNRSSARSALAEAAAHFYKAIEQLALLPDTAGRQRQELELWSALGPVLRHVKGQAAEETGRSYTRARALWETLGSPAEFVQIPYGQSVYHTTRGELRLARRVEADLLRLSRRRNDIAGLILGHQGSGRTLMIAGRFRQSRSHLERALALYDPVVHRALVSQAQLHPDAASQAFLGIVLCCLGFPDQAMARSDAAIAKARQRAHPPSVSITLFFGAMLLSLVGDNAGLAERADQYLQLAAEHGFPTADALGMMLRGCAKMTGGDPAEGLSLLRSGAQAYRGTGAQLYTSFGLHLAEACEIAGRHEEARIALAEVSEIVVRSGERWFEAELYRLQARLLQRRKPPEAAAELHEKALGIARRQAARLWELRAAVDLARLRGEAGRRAEGRELLAPIYGWFTEGFGMPDLREAKALLDALA